MNYMLYGKARILLLTVGQIKKDIIQIATGGDTSTFAKKVDRSNLKSNVDKLQID